MSIQLTDYQKPNQYNYYEEEKKAASDADLIEYEKQSNKSLFIFSNRNIFFKRESTDLNQQNLNNNISLSGREIKNVYKFINLPYKTTTIIYRYP